MTSDILWKGRPSLKLLLVTFAGWVTRQQSGVIAYLIEENRVLKELLESSAAGHEIARVDPQGPHRGSHAAAHRAHAEPSQAA